MRKAKLYEIDHVPPPSEDDDPSPYTLHDAFLVVAIIATILILVFGNAPRS